MLGVADPFSLGFVCTAFRSPRASAVGLEALEDNKSRGHCALCSFLLLVVLDALVGLDYLVFLESLEGLALRRTEPRLSGRA